MTRAQLDCKAMRHFRERGDRGAGHKTGWAYLTVEVAKIVLVESVGRKDVCNLCIYFGTSTWPNAASLYLKADFVMLASWL